MSSAPAKKQRKKTRVYWLAVVIAAVILVAFFWKVPTAEALEGAKETVTDLFQNLFPPKDGTVVIEGETEVISQEAGGQVPATQQDGTVAAPGFVIYYDTTRYEMTQDESVTYIRFVTDAEIPPCEVEIRHVPGLSPEQAAQASRNDMISRWEEISQTLAMDGMEGVSYHFSAGSNWDSACGDVYFISDGQDGCFRIDARYFLEASEGHGARFAQMVQTFSVLEDAETN